MACPLQIQTMDPPIRRLSSRQWRHVEAVLGIDRMGKKSVGLETVYPNMVHYDDHPMVLNDVE